MNAAPGSPVKLQLVGGELTDRVKVDPRIALDPDLSGSAVENDPATDLLLFLFNFLLELTEQVVDEAGDVFTILHFLLNLRLVPIS